MLTCDVVRAYDVVYDISLRYRMSRTSISDIRHCILNVEMTTYDVAISYIRRTISYVKIQVLASRTCNVVYDVVYDIVSFLYDIVRATYDITEKRTT